MVTGLFQFIFLDFILCSDWIFELEILSIKQIGKYLIAAYCS